MSTDDDKPDVESNDWFFEPSPWELARIAEEARIEAQSAALVVNTAAAGFVIWAQEYLRIWDLRRQNVWLLPQSELEAIPVPPTAHYPAHRLKFGRWGYDYEGIDEPRFVDSFILYALDMGHNQAMVRGCLCDNDMVDYMDFVIYRELFEKAATVFSTGNYVKLPELEEPPVALDGKQAPALLAESIRLPAAETEPQSPKDAQTALAEGEPGQKPRVPKRQAELHKWHRTWQLIKGQVEQGKTDKYISDWLSKMHKGLACSADTVGDIRRAGDAHLIE